MAYNGTNFELPFDPTGYTTINGAQLAQLVGGLGMASGIGMWIKTLDVLGVPSVPDVATYPQLAAFGWLRIGSNFATLYVWNPGAAIDPVFNQWIIANISSLPAGGITGSQIALATITDSNILSVGWGKLPSGGAVGGVLTGSMPNPALANQSVLFGNIAPSATALQQLRVNAAATAVEWFTPSVTISGIAATIIGTAAVAQIATAHTLGVVPTKARVVLVCVTNDAATGYVAGAEMDLNNILVAGSAFTACSFFVDAAKVYINWNTSGAACALAKFDGSGQVAPTAIAHFQFKAYLGA